MDGFLLKEEILSRKSTFLFAEKCTSLFAEIGTFPFAEKCTLLFTVYIWIRKWINVTDHNHLRMTITEWNFYFHYMSIIQIHTNRFYII